MKDPTEKKYFIEEKVDILWWALCNSTMHIYMYMNTSSSQKNSSMLLEDSRLNVPYQDMSLATMEAYEAGI